MGAVLWPRGPDAQVERSLTSGTLYEKSTGRARADRGRREGDRIHDAGTLTGVPGAGSSADPERLPGEAPPGWFNFGSAVHRAAEAFDRARIAARIGGTALPGSEVLEKASARRSMAPVQRRRDPRLHVRSEPVLRACLEHESVSEAEPAGRDNPRPASSGEVPFSRIQNRRSARGAGPERGPRGCRPYRHTGRLGGHRPSSAGVATRATSSMTAISCWMRWSYSV